MHKLQTELNLDMTYQKVKTLVRELAGGFGEAKKYREKIYEKRRQLAMERPQSTWKATLWQKGKYLKQKQEQYGGQLMAGANLGLDIYNRQWASAAYRAATFPRAYSTNYRKQYTPKWKWGKIKPSRGYFRRKRLRRRAKGYLRAHRYKMKRGRGVRKRRYYRNRKYKKNWNKIYY